jgi:hypothetical protein
LVIWVSSLFSFSSISFALLSCVGVDNALIKGDCEHKVDMCPCGWVVMSDCQRDLRLGLSR